VTTPASVAQPSSPSELLPPGETNRVYNKHIENQLLLLNHDSILKKGREYEIKLLSRYERIGGHQKNLFRTLRHFYTVGCSFGKDVEKKLGINNQTAHRQLNRLFDAGFIERITRTDIPRKDGVKTTLYGVFDVTNTEIDKAVSRDLMYSSKSYAFVERLYQRTLPEINHEGIQFSKIVNLARNQGKQNLFPFLDIADHVARKHSMNGIKVWK
jgi:DNA-binding MarR family transcriptional regulator